jgi:DNA primase
LFTELNKILLQDKQKKDEHHRREEAKQPAPDIEPVAKAPTINPEELQEREMVRLLLNYADSELEEDVDLLSYFISEFEDIEFLNESYGYIYHTFLEHKNEGDLIDSRYFLSHAPDNIKRIVAELTLRKYYTSPHWSTKYHIFFSDEKEMLQEHAHQNVLRKKYRYLQRLIEENKEKLKDAEKRISEKEIDELLDMQMKLKNADLEIARELGIVSGRYY